MKAMKDTIQQISVTAKKSVPKGVLSPELWIEQYNAIFGRLIIDECVKVMHKQERIPAGFLYSKSAHIHELAIRQHFGVNE